MDRVCHFEIPYSEKDRMESFYNSVFGWQFSSAPGDMPYTFAMTTEVDETMRPREAGGINGGTYARGPEGLSDSPVLVLEVDSCEQRVKEVEAAGGKLIAGPDQVGEMGIYAQVKDTEDNIIGLWQSLGEK